MHVQLILNPQADNGRGRKHLDEIQEAAQPYGGLDLVQTEYPGHAIELARQAAAAGYEVVAGAGGDGTISDVVNGLVQADRTMARLGVVPIGSGNDLAWDLGLPMDPATAVTRLFTGQPRPIDLARVEDEYGRSRIMDNNLGMGFDAQVVVETQQINWIYGFPMYFWAVLKTIALRYHSPMLNLCFDGEEVRQPALFVTLGLGRRHGGGFMLTPDARHDDNLIDSCTVNAIGRVTMLQMLSKAVKGTHIHSQHVTMRQSQCIRVRSDRPLPIHIDGEMFAYPADNVRQLTITSLPAAVEVIV